MLKLPPENLTHPGQRYALELLTDLARLLPVALPGMPGVRVVVEEGTAADIVALRARGFGIMPGDGVVGVSHALLEQVVALAGAAVEQGTAERDRFGRVPSFRNPLVTAGLIDVPVINEAAAALRAAVARAAGRGPVALVNPWPGGRRWAASLTHDLDVVDRWPAFALLRMSELLRHRRPGLAARVAWAALRATGRDPVWEGVSHILNVEQRLGIRAAWFILCGDPTLSTMLAGDLTYPPEGPRTRRIVHAIGAQGHEIGLHGSFATCDDGAAMARQRARLRELSGQAVDGVRQHYLRMRPGTTQEVMARAGFRYDATYGFPDRQGFRLGAAEVLAGWDARAGRASGLEEVPLVWMDRAASKYQRVEDPDAWVTEALAFADRCRAVEGAWVGLWHPNLTDPLGFLDAPGAFTRLAEGLVARDPWIAPLGELVAWRRRRRAARARGVSPDGRIILSADPDVTVEDPWGRPLPAVR
jgi:peptidoglycan/xylan/chitin deacetylase (PgdA/CDA1 family)